MTPIALGSTNKDKSAGVIQAIRRLDIALQVLCYPVDSSVDPLPLGDKMTTRGAENRAVRAILAARQWDPEAGVSLGMGIESGLRRKRGDLLLVVATVIVVRQDPGTRAFELVGIADSVGVPVPQQGRASWYERATNGRLERADVLADAAYAALCQVF
jgi:non-canonical (house-cleaning) NTP pyrophosphatase